MGNAVHHDFKGNGDLLFHFFGSASGPLRDDLNVIVGDVGIGFHRQIVKGDGAPDEQQQGREQNQKTIIESEID